MYQEKKVITSNTQVGAVPPALLIVGPSKATADYAVCYLNKILCPHGGCKGCVSCTNIAQHRHHALLWIEPEQRYTLETIESIATTITLALERDSHFFFVLAQADTLSLACANSLLKLVEEPPLGYHFIFLAQQAENILPTIRSRCLIVPLVQGFDDINVHPLFKFFTYGSLQSSALFLKSLEQSKITDQESILFFDALINHWMLLYKNEDSGKKKLHAYKILQTLHSYSQYLPMSGSAKLFLKNLYLAIQHCSIKK